MNEDLERVNEKVYRRKRMKGRKGRSFMGGKGSHRYHDTYTMMFSENKNIKKMKNDFYEPHNSYDDEEFENPSKTVQESVKNAERIASKMKNGLTYSLEKKKRWEIFKKVQEEDLFGGIVINNAYCRKDRCVDRYLNQKGNFRFREKTFQVENAEREIKNIEEMSSTSEEEYIFPPSKHKKKNQNKYRSRRRYRCGKKNPKSAKYYTPVCTDGYFRQHLNWDVPDQKKKKSISGRKKEFLQFIKTQPYFYLIERSDRKAQYQRQKGGRSYYSREKRGLSNNKKKKRKQRLQRDIRQQLKL